MAKLTDFRDRSAPIGVQGVIDYCDEMNARYPDAPYVWLVGTKTKEDGRKVRFVNPVRKTEIRPQSPGSVTPQLAQRVLGEQTREQAQRIAIPDKRVREDA